MRELREDAFFENKNEDPKISPIRESSTLYSFVSIFPEYDKTQYCYVCSCLLLLEQLKDGWIDSLQELSTLGTSLKRPLYKGNVHHQRLLTDLKTSTTSRKKATNHYTKLGNGPIPKMTQTQALTTIQTMADHSQKWHDGTSSRNISSRSHLDKECPLNEEVKPLEEVKCGEFRRSTPFNRSASVNLMHRNIFEYLRLANLRNTNMLVEMADMTKGPLEETQNDILAMPRGEKDHNFIIPTEKIFMIKSDLDNRPQSPACSDNQLRNLRDRTPDDSLQD
ncbi:hypothetical protein Tco_0682523 [Tanacetum coccineum]|uniref:Uncharacterized protein n=1 Tax=Tanacetum coccineum TaxID=301880 RepID=A0ABQ4XST5_9ASTR